MIVYVNGCSHSAGACVHITKTYPHMFMNSVVGKDNYTDILLREKHKGGVVYHSDLLDGVKGDEHILVNQAFFGKSNDGIYFETIDFILRMESKGLKPDYVFVQWSSPNRKLITQFHMEDWEERTKPTKHKFCDLTSNIAHVNPHDDWGDAGLLFEPYASKHTLQLMVSMQEFLKQRNIDYIFIPYMELINNKHLIELDLLDKSKLTTDLFKGHRNEFRKRSFVCDTQGHPDILGNYFIYMKCLEMLGMEMFIKGLKQIGFSHTVYKQRNHPSILKVAKQFWDTLGDASVEEFNRIKKKIGSII